MELTSRQRLTRLFKGEEIDRIPIWLLAPYHRLIYYADIYHIPCYQPVVQAISKYCDTFDRRRPEMGFCYNANPEIHTTKIREAEKTGTTVIFKDINFEKYTGKVNGITKNKFFVTDPGQLTEILKIPYYPPKPDLVEYKSEKQELGENGLFMMDLGDPLEVLYHLCSAQDFSMWTLTDFDILTIFIDEMYRRVLALYQYFLENEAADVYFIVGAEFAGPPLVSPVLFNTLCSKYVKGIVDLIHQYGKYAIVHYHGNLLKVLSGIKDIAPDGLHTVESPPIGNCTIQQARDILGKEMILIGNIQYDDLIRKSPDEIEMMVKEAINQGQSGKFILSPTAGPYENFLQPQAVANYLAFIEAGIKYGKLS